MQNDNKRYEYKNYVKRCIRDRAYRFEICHDEHLLCDYLLLHTLLEELYVQAAQKGVSGAPKCRLKC